MGLAHTNYRKGWGADTQTTESFKSWAAVCRLGSLVPASALGSVTRNAEQDHVGKTGHNTMAIGTPAVIKFRALRTCGRKFFKWRPKARCFA